MFTYLFGLSCRGRGPYRGPENGAQRVGVIATSIILSDNCPNTRIVVWDGLFVFFSVGQLMLEPGVFCGKPGLLILAGCAAGIQSAKGPDIWGNPRPHLATADHRNHSQVRARGLFHGSASSAFCGWHPSRLNGAGVGGRPTRTHWCLGGDPRAGHYDPTAIQHAARHSRWRAGIFGRPARATPAPEAVRADLEGGLASISSSAVI